MSSSESKFNTDYIVKNRDKNRIIFIGVMEK